MSNTLQILAFDFGLKWVGVASGQSITGTANPVTTLAAKRGKVVDTEVTALIDEWRPTDLVVGLPLNMDGTESDMCKRARNFAKRLGELTGLATHLIDERLSTRAAIERTHEIRTGRANDPSHAEAACVIAETFLRSFATPATAPLTEDGKQSPPPLQE